MSGRWLILFAVACSSSSSSSSPPPPSPKTEAAPVEQAPATPVPDVEGPLTTMFAKVKAAVANPGAACTELVKPQTIPTVTFEALDAIVAKRPPPPSSALTTWALLKDLNAERAGTASESAKARLAEGLPKQRRLAVYELTTFRDWTLETEGVVEGRLVVIDLVGTTPPCHLPIAVKQKREPDELDDTGKPRSEPVTFTSYVSAQVRSKLMDFEK